MFTGTVRRLFWVSMGATAGVLIFRAVTKTAKELTPAGIADRVSDSGGSMFGSLKEFIEDVRDAAKDREDELNVALGLDTAPRKSDAVPRKSDAAPSESDGSSKKARATEGRSAD